MDLLQTIFYQNDGLLVFFTNDIAKYIGNSEFIKKLLEKYYL